MRWPICRCACVCRVCNNTGRPPPLSMPAQSCVCATCIGSIVIIQFLQPGLAAVLGLRHRWSCAAARGRSLRRVLTFCCCLSGVLPYNGQRFCELIHHRVWMILVRIASPKTMNNTHTQIMRAASSALCADRPARAAARWRGRRLNATTPHAAVHRHGPLHKQVKRQVRVCVQLHWVAFHITLAIHQSNLRARHRFE